MKFVGKERFRRLIVDALILLLIVIANALAQPISGPVEYGTGLSVSTASPPVVSIASSQSSLTCSSCTIFGGTINNATIGASTPSTGSFTSVVLGAGTISAPALTVGTSFGIFQPASGNIEWESGGTEIFDYGYSISGISTFHTNLESTGSIQNFSSTIQLTAAGLNNTSSSDYGLFNVATSGGPVISRNEADAVPTLVIDNKNASSTGNILDLENSGGLVVSVNQAGVGNFTAGVEGVSTNSNASAGIIGQYVSSNIAVGSAVSLTSGTAANVTSISLTAGDWDVNGTVAFAPAGTTTTTSQTAAINTTSATVPTLADTAPVAIDDASLGAGVGGYLPTGTGRISLSSTTTVYLVAESTFAVSTSTAYGFIRARRVR